MKKKIVLVGIAFFIILCAGLFLLHWRTSSEIIRSQVKCDNGDIIYIPDKETISFDEESCSLYYDNILSVYLRSDLPERERKALAHLVNGKIIGNISGCINYVQIKVKESSFEELNHMADILNQSENVLYASYDAPMFMQPSVADNNPWSNNTSSPETDRGNENNPDGKDWWAEAIGAYTAWEYVDSHADELKPVKVGVIDSGFFTKHEELRGKIEILNGVNMPFDSKGKFDAHGTAVSGIIAAKNDNRGIRGVADRSSLLCADWNFFDKNKKEINLLSTGQYIELTKQMIEKECKVINCSFGNIMLSKESYENAVREEKDINAVAMDMYPFISSLLNNYSYEKILSTYQISSKCSSVNSCILLIELLLNKQNQFLIVQAAGNGYDNHLDLPGYDASYTGYYCGITEDLFNQISSRKDINDFFEAKEITFQAIDEHLLIVGGVEKQRDVNGKHPFFPGSGFGRQVDIGAPGNQLFVCGTVENDISKYNENWGGTSFSAPMVSGAAALLWSVDPNLSAAAVRELLLESETKAVGVGKDAGTEYPMLNIGASMKKLTGWNNADDIQEGLYIAPGTRNLLYVEQDEDEIYFCAWWFRLASIEETAKLDGKDVKFVCGEEATGQSSGEIHFENSKAILTLDDNRFPYLDEQTEYSWMREDLWNLSEEQLREIGKSLNVPEDLNIEYTQDEAYYWDVGGHYLTYVQILLNGNIIAAATVDSFTGELIKDILMYSDVDIQSSAENIPDGTWNDGGCANSSGEVFICEWE